MKLFVGMATCSFSETRWGAGIRESSTDSHRWKFVIGAASRAPSNNALTCSASCCSERYRFSARRPCFKEGM